MSWPWVLWSEVPRCCCCLLLSINIQKWINNIIINPYTIVPCDSIEFSSALSYAYCLMLWSKDSKQPEPSVTINTKIEWTIIINRLKLYRCQSSFDQCFLLTVTFGIKVLTAYIVSDLPLSFESTTKLTGTEIFPKVGVSRHINLPPTKVKENLLDSCQYLNCSLFYTWFVFLLWIPLIVFWIEKVNYSRHS